MELGARVLSRLDRIERLERAGAPPADVLGELRELLVDAEEWVRVEGDERAHAAVTRLRQQGGGMHENGQNWR